MLQIQMVHLNDIYLVLDSDPSSILFLFWRCDLLSTKVKCPPTLSSAVLFTLSFDVPGKLAVYFNC